MTLGRLVLSLLDSNTRKQCCDEALLGTMTRLLNLRDDSVTLGPNVILGRKEIFVGC